MRYVVAKLIWKIWMLAPIMSMVLVFGSTPVFARGGGHSDGGHAGGGHSGGHGGRSCGQRGHHGVHTGGKHGRITSGTTENGYSMKQRRCPFTDKTLADCPELGEKQWQEIPAEKAGNRFESRFD